MAKKSVPGRNDPAAGSPAKPVRRRKTKVAVPACDPQFPGVVVPLSIRPRLMPGDVVELCRGCLPGNKGKLAIVDGIDSDGWAVLSALGRPFETICRLTGEPGGYEWGSTILPDNLYRRSNLLKFRQGGLKEQAAEVEA